MNLNIDPEWLIQMAEKEDNCIVSSGGLIARMETASKALDAVRQYQKDRQAYGVCRVFQYFDDVEGDWLENWDDDRAP